MSEELKWLREAGEQMNKIIRAVWDFFSPPVPAQQLIQKSKHVNRILVFARELIADRRRWTTGAEARMDSGSECNPLRPEAVCFCANGAIRACATNWMSEEMARRTLARAIEPDGGRALAAPYSVVADLNDRKGHAAILAAFDKAIREGA